MIANDSVKTDSNLRVWPADLYVCSSKFIARSHMPCSADHYDSMVAPGRCGGFSDYVSSSNRNRVKARLWMAGHSASPVVRSFAVEIVSRLRRTIGCGQTSRCTHGRTELRVSFHGGTSASSANKLRNRRLVANLRALFPMTPVYSSNRDRAPMGRSPACNSRNKEIMPIG